MSAEDIIDESTIITEKILQGSDVDEDATTTRKTCPGTSSTSSFTSYRIYLVKDLAQDAEICQACQLFNVPVRVTDDFKVEPTEEDVLSVYVLDSFESVKKNGQNYIILGRTAMLELAQKREKEQPQCTTNDSTLTFPIPERPLYCHTLSGQVICFEGYRKSQYNDIERLKSLILLVHHMGGSVRREANCKTTFVIARLCEGKEYLYAAAFGVTVVSEMWIFDAWENRHVVGFNAADLSFVAKHKLKPFHRSRVCFVGFPEDEKSHMIEILKENGGEPVEIDDPMCTHLVAEKSYETLVSAYSDANYDECCAPSTSCEFLMPFSSMQSFIRSPDDDDRIDVPIPYKKPRLMECDPYRGHWKSKSNANANAKSNWRAQAPVDEQPRWKTARKLKRTATYVIKPGSCSTLKEEEDTMAMDVDVDEDEDSALSDMSGEESRSADDSIFFNTSGDNCPIPDFLSLFASLYTTASNFQEENTVVDESKLTSMPQLKSTGMHIVKAEWFWTSVQHEYRQSELEFKVDDGMQVCNISTASPSNTTPLSASTTTIMTNSGGRNRKRKRLKDRFPSFSSDFSPGQLAQKRRSSASDATRLDVTRLSEGSYLDITHSPDIVDDAVSSPAEKVKTTARYHKFLELCQTETNYVKILTTIMTMFKEALENMVDEKEQLLNATEMKIIFGHLPPIYNAHCNMLEELKQMLARWTEDCSIGELILKYSNDLLKAYPPFINFFENTRDMLIKCDRMNPRFHAFLKVCQSKPECGRQSLQDLLIRPVQRLPSINLLLNDILRYTSKTSCDYKALEAAIVSIQDVMAHINEDKRKTEGQVALFDIFNDIENCPAHLVSSQRCFISRCEVTELSDSLSGRGNPLVLFLFSDVIEVCKKRTKAFNNLKSPKENGGSLGSRHNTKLYKHVKLLPLSAIMKVVDVLETEVCHNIFALMMKSCHELKEQKNMIYSFTLTDESMDKGDYLRILCNQIANIVCRTDTESYLTSLEAQQLDIESSEVTTGTLGKAFNKFATKTRIKVGRALSFNKTPNKLKRAVSTMLSPFGGQSVLTSTAHLANLQLAALPAIPNYPMESKSLESPSPTLSACKNSKPMLFSMGSLRRL